MTVQLPTARPDLAEAMRYLANRAQHTWPSEQQVTFRIGEIGGGPVPFTLQVSGGDPAVETVSTARGALAAVYTRAHATAFTYARAHGWVRLHAAVLDGRGGRVAVVGATGSGKTTVACRLLLDGAAVAGDESVMLRRGRSRPVARRFHLKPGLEAVVPEMRTFTADLPSVADGDVRAFDPAEAGFAWRVGEAPIAHVVLLTSRPGEHLRPCPAGAVLPEVLQQTFPLGESAGRRVAEVAGVLRTARCWTLGRVAVADAAHELAALADGDTRPTMLRDTLTSTHERSN